MKLNYKLTNMVKEFIKDSVLTEISIGCSNSQVIKIEKSSGIYFLKIAEGSILTTEYEKLKWLKGKLRVPNIVMYENIDNIEYLITEAILGEMLCSEYYMENPMLGIPIIVEAFNELSKVDIKDCPFNVDLNYKLELVKTNISNKLLDINNISKEVLEKFKTPENIYNYLVNNREIVREELCFSHGDISLPNIFALENALSGFIDVGESGVAEKWFDIALVVRSIKRNYGESSVKEFYKQLGIEENQNKVNYYLLMMELYL